MTVLTTPTFLGMRSFAPTTAPRSTFDIAVHGRTLTVNLKNRDREALTVHFRSFTLDRTPAGQTVQAGREIVAAWQCPKQYDLSLHAPHGTYRQISGRMGEPQVDAQLRTSGSSVVAKLFNPNSIAIEVVLDDGASQRTLVMKPFACLRIPVATPDGAYEVNLHVVSTESHQVLAGHL